MDAFNRDLEIGQTVEKEFAKILENIGATDITENNDYRYDISCNISGIPKLFEVKFDQQTISSPNLAIEFESRGKASGISTSEADYWVYKIFFEGRWVFATIKSSKLKEIILSESYWRIVNGGDSYTSKLYLFRKEVFVNACHKIIG